MNAPAPPAPAFPPDPFAYARRRTIEVRVGALGIGGANPIRVQSMTTTDTRDVAATAAQAERLAAAGCELIRITAPSLTEARALREIKAALHARGVHAPLCADIHFTPNAALEAALHVEKVRVNPGNYADRKKFAQREYTDAEYQAARERAAESFRPLVRRCKELGRALRIGANHGSLSDRIMNRFGDTPEGMVQSALEFLAVCESEGFRDVVFSMKASAPQTAVHAYRLLAARLEERAAGAPSYPLHLGVTEAGFGEEGRVKSAIGIGALLEDGIGDTIRVSLTEDPVKEIPVAQALAAMYQKRAAAGASASAAPLPARVNSAAAFPGGPYASARRKTRAASVLVGAGGKNPPRVEASLGPPPPEGEAAAAASALARELAGLGGELACEGLQLHVRAAADVPRARAFAAALRRAQVAAPLAVQTPPEFAAQLAPDFARVVLPRPAACGAPLPAAGALPCAVEWRLPPDAAAITRAFQHGAPDLISLAPARPSPREVRLLAATLNGVSAAAAETPLLLRHQADPFAAADTAPLGAAACMGAALCDGLGDAVALGGFGSAARAVRLGYRILQGARRRSAWTEFISCPSCGRTLFDLEEVTARVKAQTAHLPGLKIAVMGCIVNGPGEMADADFGYVGSGVGRVDLYAGRRRVLRNVPEAEAVQRLADLIRAQGLWREPAPPSPAGARG